MSKTLIVGSNGFIGSSFNKNYEKFIFLSRKNINNKNISLDLSKDNLENLLFDFNDISSIIHTAGISHHNEYNENEIINLNNKITNNVLQFFLNSNASRLIFLSSGKVYGSKSSEPVREDSLLKPYDVIGKSKLLQEENLYKKSSNSKKIIICRLFNAYGKNQNINFVIPKIKHSYYFESKIHLGNIDVMRDFIYIDDVLAALEMLLSYNMLSNNYEIFNISTQRATSISRIMEIFSSLLNKNIEIKIDENLKRPEGIIEVGSNKKIKKFLNWSPEVDMYQGIKKILI